MNCRHFKPHFLIMFPIYDNLLLYIKEKLKHKIFFLNLWERQLLWHSSVLIDILRTYMYTVFLFRYFQSIFDFICMKCIYRSILLFYFLNCILTQVTFWNMCILFCLHFMEIDNVSQCIWFLKIKVIINYFLWHFPNITL